MASERLLRYGAIFLSAVLVAPVRTLAVTKPRVVVIGFDGLDPKILQKYMDKGDLPNFKKLASTGTSVPLETSNPPQSPVAWSCFISGCNPGHHDVFDFVVRDPAKYQLEIGMTETRSSDTGAMRALFQGLTGPSLHTRRKGITFWDVLGSHGIPSVILRCPVTFPAEKLEGRLLSGMGTPDIRGTQGIYTFYSEGEASRSEGSDLHGRIVSVTRQDRTIDTELTGPRVRSSLGVKDASVPLKITIVSDNEVEIVFPDERIRLKAGQWSPWVRLEFKTGLLTSISGLARFLVKSVNPKLAMYATAVNIDPEKPAMPISYPAGYAGELRAAIGNYCTQGMPFDTWALNEGRLSEKEFLDFSYDIFDENKKSFSHELDRFKEGFLFAYFGITDLVQHMFWRYEDPEHPNRGASKDPNVINAIRNVYIEADKLLGRVFDRYGKSVSLIVLSDHGFGSFRRAVHINSWLIENGYLVLKDGQKIGADFFENVNWEETRAYSIGFGGVYVNQFGREKNGIVYKGAETEALKAEISKQLLDWRDNGKKVVKQIYTSADLYKGPYSANGPDLFIGFNETFRASWQTGLGAAPEGLIENNMRMWGGDHLCDPSLVPGVLLTNFKLSEGAARLVDIGPTILKLFNISKGEEIEGRPLIP